MSGYSEEEIADEGEAISDSAGILDSILNNMAAYTSSHDAIYEAQKDAILELAKNPCIIVGRCSNVILREAGIPSFDIFLHAEYAIRVERVKALVSDKVTSIEKYVERVDEQRETLQSIYGQTSIRDRQNRLRL